MTWDYTDAERDVQANKDPIWRLERLILYGLHGAKIAPEELKRHLPLLRIPADRRAFLELLVWDKPF